MSDPYPITETIIDADGLNAEAFARLHREWFECELIFGMVPCEVETDDATLTVTIHDPLTTATDAGDGVDMMGQSDLETVCARRLEHFQAEADRVTKHYDEVGADE